MEFALQTSGRYEDVLEVARFSERHGLPAIALPDHYLMGRDDEAAATRPAPDALIQLAGLSRDTMSLDLVVLVSPITFRHPAVLTKAAITIDRMSGGRFTLGIGTGWMDREHEVFGFPYPPMATRFEMMEEALAYCRAALTDPPAGFEGRHYSLEAFPISPRPIGTVKLLVGGSGAVKTPRLAGTYADEFNAYVGKDLAERIARARRAAADAGRNPDALLISSAGQVIGGRTEQDVANRLDELAQQAGRTVEDVRDALERGHAPVGTYGQLRETFADMEAAGVARFYIQGAFDAERAGELLSAMED